MNDPQNAQDSGQNIIDVGCALIIKGDSLLIAQRKPGSRMSGYWEFPGGKKEPEESMEECLVREAWEELAVTIRPKEEFGIKFHVYPGRVLRLHFYLCEWLWGKPVRKDCLDFRWAKPEELYKFLFLPADRDIIWELNLKKRYYFRKGYLF